MKNQITSREKEILLLILDEHTSQSIADTLKLSIRTIDTHRKNILKKTNTKTLIGLFKYAIQAELVGNYYYRAGIAKDTKKNT